MASLWDRLIFRRNFLSSVPPPVLRYRVHGHPGLSDFLKIGRLCQADITQILNRMGRRFDSFHNILDFGCGCGRTLIWFSPKGGSPSFFGTDIDREAVSWCRDHLPFAQFEQNDRLPPLSYPSQTFDLVYAVSVFTHFDEELQFLWLRELRRVMKSGGILLLSLHGEYYQKRLPPDALRFLKEHGFAFVKITSKPMDGIPSGWFQNAYHTKDYILKVYSKEFNVLDYLPKGFAGYQDVVLLEKP